MSLILFHSNDVHGHIDNLQYLLKKYRDDASSLWFDSGDALCGSNTVFRWHEPILQLMSELNCAAMAMGNREFNYQRWVMRRRARQRNFPLLCANLRDLRGYPAAWRESLTLDTDEGRVVIIGATPVQYPSGSLWEKVFGFRFLDPLDILPPLAHSAGQKGEAVIILSHLGIDVDKMLLPLLPAGTLVLGGHTHTALHEPVEINGSWIVQGGSWARFLAKLEYDVPARTLRSYELLNR